MSDHLHPADGDNESREQLRSPSEEAPEPRPVTDLFDAIVALAERSPESMVLADLGEGMRWYKGPYFAAEVDRLRCDHAGATASISQVTVPRVPRRPL